MTETVETYMEAPRSFTIKAYKNGYDCMMTVRAVETADMLEQANAILDWLPKNGYEPQKFYSKQNNGGNGNDPRPPAVAAAAQSIGQEPQQGGQQQGEWPEKKWCSKCNEVMWARPKERPPGTPPKWYSHKDAQGEWCKGAPGDQ